jgi:hypothetical protein
MVMVLVVVPVMVVVLVVVPVMVMVLVVVPVMVVVLVVVPVMVMVLVVVPGVVVVLVVVVVAAVVDVFVVVDHLAAVVATTVIVRRHIAALRRAPTLDIAHRHLIRIHCSGVRGRQRGRQRGHDQYRAAHPLRADGGRVGGTLLSRPLECRQRQTRPQTSSPRTLSRSAKCSGAVHLR